ncbi:hypothetical protein ACGF0J_11130 [Nonomuraea sp. NPDC047897]|uniref:hypothetical protein n=1 Tax=Nonomuraea sp. NPDC047897 TaxID=3364346 RepID=UPI003710BD06
MKTDLDGTEIPLDLHGGLHRRISRLRHITGFATTYGAECDPRAAVFARLWHVQRVASVTALLAKDSYGVDPDRAGRLAWIHDLNRWPFAHNSERGNFDQAANVSAYFKGLDVASRDIVDLERLHRKDPHGLTPEGEVVLLADALTGIVEDLLMAVTGLNVHPRLVPPPVDAVLGFSLQAEPWSRECRALAEHFHRSPDPDVQAFQYGFNGLFHQLVDRFLARHEPRRTEHGHTAVYDVARTVKETFTRPTIFPINNERVCRSTWLREQVLPWYLRTLGGSRDGLLDLDEPQFVALVTAPGSPFTPSQFRPDIDVVRRQLPHLAFVT